MATYDPTLVALIYGPLPISGFADGTMIQDSPIGDGVKGMTGTGGETAFIETANRQRELTFRLTETANAMNIALEALFNAGNPELTVFLNSISTGQTMVAARAKLERIPGTSYDAGWPIREWKIIMLKAEHVMVPVP